MDNIHPGTVNELYKIASINLAPNGVGQVAMSCLVNGPKQGTKSYEQYQKVCRRGLEAAAGVCSTAWCALNVDTVACSCSNMHSVQYGRLQDEVGSMLWCGALPLAPS